MAENVEIAERLRLAREESRLTQQQVADWLGIRRPGVVEMEAGKRAVKSDELARLAILYGRSISWLAGADPAPEDALTAALFRATEAADSTLRREAQLLARRCRLLAEVEGRFGLGKTTTLPQYADDDALLDWTSAVDHGRAVAYQERQRLGLGVIAPLNDAWGIVEGAGLHVFPLQLGAQHSVDGIFAVLSPRHACVGVNVDKWVFRQIFTVVHECAHALFDRGVSSEVCNTSRAWALGDRSLYTNRELRANQFAAVFLVPREALLRYLEVHGRLGVQRSRLPEARGLTAVDIVRGQDHFGVSAEMLLWRLQNEQLLPAGERHRLLAEVHARGVNALARSLGYNWPGRAKPITQAQELALKAYAKGHLSLGALAELFGFPKSDMAAKLREWGVAQEFAEDDALLGTPSVG